MSPELVNALTGLIDALRKLIQVTGTGGFAVIVIVAALLFVGVPWLREFYRNKKVDIVIEHKEREIERLAADNHMYRDTYLVKTGFPGEVLKGDAQDSKAAGAKREAERGKKP